MTEETAPAAPPEVPATVPVRVSFPQSVVYHDIPRRARPRGGSSRMRAEKDRPRPVAHPYCICPLLFIFRGAADHGLKAHQKVAPRLFSLLNYRPRRPDGGNYARWMLPLLALLRRGRPYLCCSHTNSGS